MSDTAIEPVLDESLDFSIPCDYSAHEWISVGDLPAEWAISMTNPPCGHAMGGLLLFCDPCKKVRTGEVGSDLARCPVCGIAGSKKDSIISMERL